MGDSISCEVLRSAQNANEDVLGGDLFAVSRCTRSSPIQGLAYMKIQGHGHDQSRDRETIADFLHQNTGGSECRRSNVVAAVVVHNNADGKIYTSRNATAQCESLRVFSRVCHLRDDGKVGWYAAESKDDRCNCCHSFRKCRCTEELICRDIRTVLRRLCRAILNADSNS
jgi:hypothetical protein